MPGTKVKRVPPRDFAKEWAEYNKAARANLGTTLEHEALFRPQSAAIDLDVFREFAPKYLDFYDRKINPRVSEMEARHRSRAAEADVGLLEKYGAPLRQAMLDSDPESAALLNKMSAQAAEDLSARGLTDRFRRDLTQDLRASQAARGTGYGLSDIISEALLSSQARLGLEDRARANASAVLGLRNQATGGALNLLGRSGLGHMQGLLPMVHQQTGTQILNPQDPYFERLKSGNFAAANQRAVQNAANRASLYSAGISALGSIAGGFAGGAGKAWGAAKWGAPAASGIS